MGALQARRSLAGTRASQSVAGPYGPLRPVADLETGLPLIRLPEGFEYRSFSWAGDPLSNGAPAPDLHDGMGVIAARGQGAAREITLVRNHERAIATPILAPARYDTSIPAGQGFAPAGGTTTLRFRGRQWVSAEPSLGGTIYNCAGGVTPWGSWLSCEETVIDLSAKGGRRHGYVFEVRENAGETTGRPLLDMGRMLHEAVAVDPRTHIAYLTEDYPRHSGFYRFIAEQHERRRRKLRSGRTTPGGPCRRPQQCGPANPDRRRPSSHRLGGHRESGLGTRRHASRRFPKRRNRRAARSSRAGPRARSG